MPEHSSETAGLTIAVRNYRIWVWLHSAMSLNSLSQISEDEHLLMNSFDALVQSLGLELLIEARTTDAGRGLFSIAEIPPHTVLFQIPASQVGPQT
jgi:hypothetical protein